MNQSDVYLIQEGSDQQALQVMLLLFGFPTMNLTEIQYLDYWFMWDEKVWLQHIKNLLCLECDDQTALRKVQDAQKIFRPLLENIPLDTPVSNLLDWKPTDMKKGKINSSIHGLTKLFHDRVNWLDPESIRKLFKPPSSWPDQMLTEYMKQIAFYWVDMIQAVEQGTMKRYAHLFVDYILEKEIAEKNRFLKEKKQEKQNQQPNKADLKIPIHTDTKKTYLN